LFLIGQIKLSRKSLHYSTQTLLFWLSAAGAFALCKRGCNVRGGIDERTPRKWPFGEAECGRLHR
jgi:hypothetical protein